MTTIEIRGTGSYLPGDPISNEQLSDVFGREVIWVAEMMGAHERYFALDLEHLTLRSGETNAQMASYAARQAILDAKIDPTEIDLIIMATSTPDYPFPATVLFVQEQLNLRDCCVMELRAGCGGMAQAFTIASNMLITGTAHNALLIGSDLISPYITLFHHRLDEISKDYLVSLAMFGDGAGAVVLSSGGTENGLMDCMSRSMSPGRAAGMLLRTGGALAPVILASELEQDTIFTHDYQAIIKHGPDLMRSAKHWLCDEKGYDFSTIDLFIPPQVNSRLIALTSTQMDIPAEKVFSNFPQVGNTVSASIYIALDQLNRSGSLHFGSLLVFLPAEATKWVYGAIVAKWTKGDQAC